VVLHVPIASGQELVVAAEIEQQYPGFVGRGQRVSYVVYKDIPSRKPAYPEKLAGICSFLGSDDASYITGTIIPVDGGIITVDAFSAGIGRATTELSLKDKNTNNK
jgi:NAD(P)-dependent dehydrogenase (short-subunit alcohol dehydrogenase family)